MIVQDDSGIPLAYFDPNKWNLRFFGVYLGPIDMNTDNGRDSALRCPDAAARRPYYGTLLRRIANRLQDVDDFVERRSRCRKQKRCRAATRVEIANGAKRFSGGFHRVSANRAVHMKIDKTGRKIVSIEINDLVFLLCQGSLADRNDFSFFHDNF